MARHGGHLAAIAGIATHAHAAPRSYTGTPISENFDGLGSAGTVITPLVGWDAGQFNPQQANQPGPGNGIGTVTDTSLVVDDGAIALANGTASIYNFGTTGSSDRALGSMPKTASQDLFYQLAITNDSGAPITSFTLTYTGEQWASAPSTIADSLTVWFSDNDAANGFVTMGSAFTFTAPQMNLSSKLDGNATANRIVISATFTPATPIAAGHTFYIRWYDRNDSDQDDGLGIDDVTVTPTINLLSQNFDSMGSAGTTLPSGWTAGYLGSVGTQNRLAMSPYAGNSLAITSMTPVVNDGNMPSPDVGTIFNEGTTGSSDRALGSYPRTNPSGDQIMQVAIVNTTATPLTTISVSYAGEQWRQAQGASSSGTEMLRVLASSTSATSGFSYFSSLDFTAPKQTGANTPLDGNLAENRAVITGTITLPSPVAAGGTFYLRWHDWNDNGTTDHFLAVDDVVVTATPTGSLPSVTLGLAGSPIAEAAGVATVTATLSATHTQNVTVNLAYTGTATLNTDYTASATSIVIPAGQLSGSVTLTAVQDSIWENGTDETIIVDISSVLNGLESGTQQVTATIADDDPQPPWVTLGVAGSPMAEASGTATVTATLSAAIAQNVTVNLAFTGTATLNTDYTASANNIVIPAGQLSGSITLTAVQDSLWETGTNETIIVDISSVVNGLESGTQQVTASITDDDTQPSGILLDAASTGSAGTASSVAWSHTVGSGSNRMLVVGVAAERNSDEFAASVTYGSQSLTKVAGSRASQGTPYNTTELWYLPAPAVGTATITVTFATSVANGMDCGAVSLFGVMQGPPENVAVANAIGSGSSYSLNITTYSPGAWLVDVVNNGTAGANFTPGTGMTELWDRTASGQMASACATRAVPAAGLVTDTWTTGGTSRRAQSIAAFATASPQILTFGLPDNPAAISGTSITLYVQNGTDVTNLGPSFTMTEGATCTVNGNPTSSGAQFNFTSPVHYIVQAGGLTSDYTATVVIAPAETTLVWNTTSGDWSHSAPNWLGQVSQQPTPFFNGQNVIFNKTSGGTISVAANMAPASTTVSAASGTYIFTGGPIGGSGAIIKSGGGTLKIDCATGAGCALGVSEGILTGTGSIGGALTLSGTGAIDLRDGATGTLPLGGINITGDAGANVLSFDLGNNTAATDQIAVSGAVSVSHPVIIRLRQLGWPSNRVTAGTYDLITTTTGTLPDVSNFILEESVAFGQTFSLALDATQQKLQLTTTRISSATATAVWSGESDANWSTATNWRTAVSGGSTTAGAPDYATNVTFNTTDPAANYLTNTLDRDFDINSLTFAATATSAVTIAGSNKKLTIEGGGVTLNTPASGTVEHTIGTNIGLAATQTWAVNASATLTVNGAVTDLTGSVALTKTGTGNVNLNGATTLGGDVKIGYLASCGSLVVGSGQSLSIGSGSSSNLYLSYQANNGYICNGTIDAAAAANVNINVGNAYIGTAGSMVGNSTGTLKLGASNTITASTLLAVGTSLWDVGSYGIITVADGGVATIHTPSMQVGWATANGTSGGFGTVTLGAGATMAIDGIGGGRTTLLIGYDDEQYGRSSSGTMDLSAGTAILKLSSLVVGHQNGNAGTPGTLTLGTSPSNHLDISGAGNVVRIGELGLFGTDASGWGTGTVTLGYLDSTSVIESTDNSTAILLGSRVASASGSSTGTLNLNGGTLTIKTTGTAIGTSGTGGTKNLNLDGGVVLRAGASSTAWIQGLTNAKIKSGGVAFDTNSCDITVPQALLVDTGSAGGGLTKMGNGTLALSGPNTYTGPTNASVGTLLLNGVNTGGGAVTVASNARLGGTGSTTGAVIVQPGGKLFANITDWAAGTCDHLTVASLSLPATWSVDVAVNAFTEADKTFQFLTATGGVTGFVAPTVSGPGTGTWLVRQNASDARVLELVYTVYSATPYDTWAAGTFANTFSDKDPAHDPDGDGLTNQFEFAFGLDPTTGKSVTAITAPLDKTSHKFSYTRYAASGLTYSVWTSANLQTWDKVAPGGMSENAGTPNSSGVQTVEVTLLSPPAGDKLFVRVQAE